MLAVSRWGSTRFRMKGSAVLRLRRGLGRCGLSTCIELRDTLAKYSTKVASEIPSSTTSSPAPQLTISISDSIRSHRRLGSTDALDLKPGSERSGNMNSRKRGSCLNARRKWVRLRMPSWFESSSRKASRATTVATLLCSGAAVEEARPVGDTRPRCAPEVAHPVCTGN